MDPEQNLSAEALAAEQAAAQTPKEEEVRANIISEFGFDETDDAERIDKLVKREIESRQKLSQAIGQKIKHRSEAEELRKKVTTPTPPKEPTAPTDDVSKIVSQQLEKRDLESMEYPDDLKKEIKRVAEIQGVSVKAATRDPYIAAKIETYEKSQVAEEAAISRTHKSSGKQKFSFDNPPDVDMSTEEGRKEWADYKQAMIKQGN